MMKNDRLLRRCFTTLFFCAGLLAASFTFGAGVRVPSGDLKLEGGYLDLSPNGKGVVFPDRSVQTTAAPANLKTILNGTADPIVAIVVDGDFYINTTTNTLFGPKSSGAWPAGVSLVGPTGPTGSAGKSGAGYSAPRVTVMNSGQMTSYAEGDDGDWRSGVGMPASIRFKDNLNGTVTDNLTGLIWLKNASCLGSLTWAAALASANGLASPNAPCSLSDGSVAGNWRLPNRSELLSLVDYNNYSPALSSGHPFTAVQLGSYYWSSSSYAINTGSAWDVSMINGIVYNDYKYNFNYVWPVRGGQ